MVSENAVPAADKGSDGVNLMQVSGEEQEFAVESMSERLDKVIEEIRQGPSRIEKDLTEARIAGKYRTQLMRVWDIQAEEACKMLEDIKERASGYKLFGSELFQELHERGIESMDDWKEFVKSDVGHIRGVLAELPRNGQRSRLEPTQEEEKMETDGSSEKSEIADWSALRASLEAAFGGIGRSNRNI
ncbi:hypothetical protein OSTOST_16017, partial [Ostertagia ostertagi]